MKIAYVEDDRDDARDFRRRLPDDDVVIYRDVSRVDSIDFDVFFTDLRLVETLGLDTIAALRGRLNDLGAITMPVIVLTDVGEKETTSKDMAMMTVAGADLVMPKTAIKTGPLFHANIINFLKDRPII